MELGDPESAEPHLRRCQELRERSLPEGHWRTAEAQRLLGTCLVMTEHLEEAEALLTSARHALSSSLGDDHEQTRLARQALADLDAARGGSR